MRLQVVAILVFVGGIGCSLPRSSEQQPSSSQPSAVSNRAEAPVFVSWVVKASDANSVNLVARVTRRAPLAVPLKVSVIVPATVKVVSGQTAFEVPASREAGVTESPFVFSYEKAPLEDLRLVADIREPGFGLHAEDVYRFGRPVPVVEVPKAVGPSIEVGGHDLGQGVPLNP